MSNKQFISNLSATYADVRKLDVKKINLKGKNILEYIEESIPTITYTKDTRETVYRDDLWGQWVETKDDGTVIIHDDWVTNPNSSSPWIKNIKVVQDNKAYTSDDTSGEPHCNIQTEKIKDGSKMFYNSYLASFSSDLSSLVYGSNMFYNTFLKSFDNDLRSLVDGFNMFSHGSLTSFSSDLSSLVKGTNMFFDTPLTSFSSDLSSLVNGTSMFYWASLASFNSNLSSLVNGIAMFFDTPLASFSSDLSSLVNGTDMFANCTRLTSFNGDLSSLVNGSNMFHGTLLTPQSVMYIVESIRNIKEEKAKYPNIETGETGEIPWVTYDSTTEKFSAPFGFMEDGCYIYSYNDTIPHTTNISSSNVGTLTLGINVTDNSDTIEQQLKTFAEGCLCDSWAELKQEFIDKGWTVTFQYGGNTTSIPNTYDLRNGEQIIPCPIFAKLVEADKDSAEYCTEDASTFYNIDWGHDVTDTSSYTQFNSLEDAMTSWNVFPKENIITTEE